MLGITSSAQRRVSGQGCGDVCQGTASRDDPSLPDGSDGDGHQPKASEKLTEEAVSWGMTASPGMDVLLFVLVNAEEHRKRDAPNEVVHKH